MTRADGPGSRRWSGSPAGLSRPAPLHPHAARTARRGAGGDIREICERPGGDAVQPEEIEPLAPVDGRTEVWAAGVTYERSCAARVLESKDSADVYDRVYAAERPELFFKSAAWRFVALAAPCQCAPTRASTFPNPNWLLGETARVQVPLFGADRCGSVPAERVNDLEFLAAHPSVVHFEQPAGVYR